MVSDWFSALLGIPESNLFPARNLGEGERWSAVQFQVWSIKTRSANLFHMHFHAVSKILMWKRNCAQFIQLHWSHLEAAPKWVWSGSPGTSCSVPPASSMKSRKDCLPLNISLDTSPIIGSTCMSLPTSLLFAWMMWVWLWSLKMPAECRLVNVNCNFVFDIAVEVSYPYL